MNIFLNHQDFGIDPAPQSLHWVPSYQYSKTSSQIDWHMAGLLTWDILVIGFQMRM